MTDNDKIKFFNDFQEECDISIIILTRNEESLIGECIKSVLSALEYARKKNVLNSSEVILVDSASADNTIDIARKYPIRILQLDPSWQLSAGAGMYTGVSHSKGRFIAKVDGDTILYEDWFANALPELQKKGIGGVTGIYVEEVNDMSLTGNAYVNASKNQPPGEVEVIATGIFNRSILFEAGSFNPFLKAAEDRDLSWKISDLGYKLMRLPFLEIRHFLADNGKEMTYFEHLKKMFGYSIGEGHAARYSIHNKKTFWRYLRRYTTVYFSQIYILIFLWMNLLYSNYLMLTESINSMLILIIDFLVLLFCLFIITVKYKGTGWEEFLYAFHVIPYMFVREMGFILGFLKLPKKPTEYPADVKIIK